MHAPPSDPVNHRTEYLPCTKSQTHASDKVPEIGGWGFDQPGNSFGSCASVIPRLGYFQRFVLRTGAGRTVPFLLPNARRKATKKKFTSRVGYQC